MWPKGRALGNPDLVAVDSRSPVWKAATVRSLINGANFHLHALQRRFLFSMMIMMAHRCSITILITFCTLSVHCFHFLPSFLHALTLCNNESPSSWLVVLAGQQINPEDPISHTISGHSGANAIAPYSHRRRRRQCRQLMLKYCFSFRPRRHPPLCTVGYISDMKRSKLDYLFVISSFVCMSNKPEHSQRFLTRYSVYLYKVSI